MENGVKLVGGVIVAAPPVRYLTEEDGITKVSSHSTLLELTREKSQKSAPRSFLKSSTFKKS